MSEDPDQGFLDRWSRRKRANAVGRTEAEADEAALAPETEPVLAPDEEEADPDLLASLPKLEDIDANTDLTLFMQKGVPDSLRQAAMRRMWVADPAIRDFIEMADYAWDFNAPDGVPGFGPLLSVDDAGKLLAQVGQVVPKPPERRGETPQAEAFSAGASAPPGEAEPHDRDIDDGPAVSAPEPLPLDQGDAAQVMASAAALENVKPANRPVSPENGPIPSRRRHGGAVPR